ncbi:MAG: hypothetical protein JWL77_7060 [Chthonomonadaceae bacterium]|nr:hypothetical protein [Chthonomonadaceae bacterium]
MVVQRRLLSALLGLVLTTGCLGSGRGSAVPPGPADCAGPLRAQHQATLASAWTHAVKSSPQDLWIGLSRTLTPAEVIKHAQGAELVAVVYVLPERQGTYRTAVIALKNPKDAAALIGEVPPLSPLSLDVTRPTAVTPVVAARFAAGDIPVSALHVKGTEKALAKIITGHPCDDYSLSPGTSGSSPLVSERANPGG